MFIFVKLANNKSDNIKSEEVWADSLDTLFDNTKMSLTWDQLKLEIRLRTVAMSEVEDRLEILKKW